jgi:hypothetical protein
MQQNNIIKCVLIKEAGEKDDDDYTLFNVNLEREEEIGMSNIWHTFCAGHGNQKTFFFLLHFVLYILFGVQPNDG